MRLAGRRRDRPDPPRPRRLAPEGRPARFEVGDGVFREQPRQERLERLGGAVYLAHAGRAARQAAPPLRAGFRPSVLAHLGAAHAAFWIIHSPPSRPDNFLLGKACLTRRVKGYPYTLFETPGSWGGINFQGMFSMRELEICGQCIHTF